MQFRNISTESLVLVDCSLPFYFSTLVKEKASGAIEREKYEGVGAEKCTKQASRKILSVPSHYPVKSPVLRWHPVLSRFHPCVRQLNKIEACEQSSF